MDIRSRLLAARLSVRIEDHKEYCEGIGITDRSGFKEGNQGNDLKTEGKTDEE